MVDSKKKKKEKEKEKIEGEEGEKKEGDLKEMMKKRRRAECGGKGMGEVGICRALLLSGFGQEGGF